MNIILLVAKNTLLARSGKTPIVTMALNARERVVDAGEREISMEIVYFMPIRFIMTIRASLAECSGMCIFMTGCTITGNRFVMNNRITHPFECNLLLLHRLMALVTF